MATYAELSALLADTVEGEFTPDQMAYFFDAAEQKIYNAVQIPALRKNQTGTMTVNVPYLATPSDFLYIYSLAVIKSDGSYHYLIDKDVNFIREAYPNPNSTSLPNHYAIFDVDTLIVGPTPSQSYSVEMHYGYYPESIVTAGTTWLSDQYPSALLNMALIEAARFQKAEQDVLATYNGLANESLALLKNLGDGKLRQDAYRSGQVRVPVK
jgi:hypothetical protein